MQAPRQFLEQVAAGRVTEPTRRVLERRLERPDTQEPLFFNPAQFATLHAVCKCLIPQAPGGRVDLAGLLDETLATGTGNGWRYADAPPDSVLFRDGVDAVDRLARDGHASSFLDLDAVAQDRLLQRVQTGEIPEAIWPAQTAKRFFEELLASLVELYFSHPVAKAWMQDTSYADGEGWPLNSPNSTTP